MGVRLKVRWDDAGLRKAIQDTLHVNRSRIMRAASLRMKKMVRKNYDSQKDSSGRSWPALKPSTLAARRKGAKAGRKGKMLKDTGRLYASITASSTPDSATVGTNVAYSAVHQFGHGSIPKREYLYITDKDANELVKFVKTEILRPL